MNRRAARRLVAQKGDVSHLPLRDAFILRAAMGDETAARPLEKLLMEADAAPALLECLEGMGEAGLWALNRLARLADNPDVAHQAPTSLGNLALRNPPLRRRVAEALLDLLQSGLVDAEGQRHAARALMDMDWREGQAAIAQVLPDEVHDWLQGERNLPTRAPDFLRHFPADYETPFKAYMRDHAWRPRLASAATGPSRNDPCPCGSGRKFKKCCMVAEDWLADFPEDLAGYRLSPAEQFEQLGRDTVMAHLEGTDDTSEDDYIRWGVALRYRRTGYREEFVEMARRILESGQNHPALDYVGIEVAAPEIGLERRLQAGDLATAYTLARSIEDFEAIARRFPDAPWTGVAAAHYFGEMEPERVRRLLEGTPWLEEFLLE